MSLFVESLIVTGGVILAIGVINCVLLTCAIGTAVACDQIKKSKVL